LTTIDRSGYASASVLPSASRCASWWKAYTDSWPSAFNCAFTAPRLVSRTGLPARSISRRTSGAPGTGV
jgi:hypothetical protein